MACRFLTVVATTALAGAGKVEDATSLGSSGTLAKGSVFKYEDAPIKWEAGMTGHSDYAFDPKKTALLVIDPQKVYSACPENVSALDELLAPPGDKDFDGHSPLCCEKFGPALDNANKLAAQARSLSMPVFWVAHVYRGDYDPMKGEVAPNCGRLCDFDVLGWDKWPKAFNLWSEKFPWHAMDEKADIKAGDFYTEKTTYSAMTEPMVEKLLEKGVDTVIVTGFMSQFCSVTTSRHAHDLGFKVIYVTDANDGPILLETLSKVDENAFIPFTLGVAIADTIPTSDVLKIMGKDAEDTDVKESERLYEVHWAKPPAILASPPSSIPAYIVTAAACAGCFVFGVFAQRLFSSQKGVRSTATSLERISLVEE